MNGTAYDRKRGQPCPRPYYSLPCALQLCDEVIALSSNAHRLLHQVAALHHGYENSNGHIALPRSTMRALGWRSHDMFERALSELLNTGLLFQTRPATGNRPRLFALTFYPVTKPDGLTFIPDGPVPMPGMTAVLAVLADLNNGGAGATWSMKTGAFVARVPGRYGQPDISRRDTSAARVPGHKKKSAACVPGRNGDFAACVPGGANQLPPDGRATHGGLPPDGRATNRAHVYRCLKGVDVDLPATPEPDLLTRSKQGGAS
jgi:hypothetical protein